MSNRVSKEIDRAADKLGIDRATVDELQAEMSDAVLALAVPWFKRAFSFIISKLGGK